MREGEEGKEGKDKKTILLSLLSLLLYRRSNVNQIDFFVQDPPSHSKHSIPRAHLLSLDSLSFLCSAFSQTLLELRCWMVYAMFVCMWIMSSPPPHQLPIMWIRPTVQFPLWKGLARLVGKGRDSIWLSSSGINRWPLKKKFTQSEVEKEIPRF